MAEILTGAWRPEPPPLGFGPEQVTAAVPLLLKTTAAPLAWRRLRTAGPRVAKAGQPLRDRYRLHALESAGHEEHLCEVLPLLRAAGVEPILLKGWAVARLYPETGLRPYCDLDLGVRPDEIGRAAATLTRVNRRELMVELHQGIPDLKDRTREEAFRRSRLVRLGDVDVRVLCPEDQLRLLCLHLMRHGAGAPLWLCDLGVLLESRSADFDWDYCLYGRGCWSAWIRCFLAVTHQLLGARTGGAPTREPPPWLVPAVREAWTRRPGDTGFFDPIRAARRRRLPPLRSRSLTQFLGLAGRVVETPARLRRQVRRWQRPAVRPFDLHDEAGA